MSDDVVSAAVMVTDVTTKKPRGFAAMDPEKVRKIASAGGKASHKLGVAHKFTSEEAKIAGHKGGVAPHRIRGRGRPDSNRPNVPSK